MLRNSLDLGTALIAEKPEAAMSKVNIAEKFAKIGEFYKPHIAAELNG
jgi:hypothetical protein